MKMRKVRQFISRPSASHPSIRYPARFLLKDSLWLWKFTCSMFASWYPWRGVKNDKNRIFSESRFEWTKMTGRHQGWSWEVQRHFVTKRISNSCQTMKNYRFFCYFEKFMRKAIDRSFATSGRPPLDFFEVSDEMRFVPGNVLYFEIWSVFDLEFIDFFLNILFYVKYNLLSAS